MNHLKEQDGAELVRLARGAIENYLDNKRKMSVNGTITEKYGEKAGVFVTLNSVRVREELRGCIGYPMPEMPLHQAVINAAIAAATSDPRFEPVSMEEMDAIALELSILSQPELISAKDPREYREKIKVGRDGLIINWRYGSGLLLPQVPVEYGWDEERFLCETCVKAGALPDCWFHNDTRLYRFEAIVFKEITPKGEVVRVPLNSK
jgi:uncharacterized protein (TIGR00296 family)